jgi:hypothetical protein
VRLAALIRAACFGSVVVVLLLLATANRFAPRPVGAGETVKAETTESAAAEDQAAETGDTKTDVSPAKAAESEDDDLDALTDPTGANAACYVCHMTFVHEEISKIHLAEKTGCIHCHGLSAAHANDENIGATKPDITYTREQVDPSCYKCHEDHDVPAKDVVARFIERELPANVAPICTDCHGTHRIEHAAEDEEAPSDSVPTMPSLPGLTPPAPVDPAED